MARDFAEKFYKGKTWKKVRKAYLEELEQEKGLWCEDCGKVQGKILHHIIELTPENIDDPEIALSFDNLKFVCQYCHNIVEHNYGRESVPDEIEYFFDENGNPVPR